MANDFAGVLWLSAFAGADAGTATEGPGATELIDLGDCAGGLEAEPEFLLADLGDEACAFAFVGAGALLRYAVRKVVGSLGVEAGIEYDPLSCLLSTIKSSGMLTSVASSGIGADATETEVVMLCSSSRDPVSTKASGDRESTLGVVKPSERLPTMLTGTLTTLTTLVVTESCERFLTTRTGMSVILSGLGEAPMARAWLVGTAAKLTVLKAPSVDTTRHGFSAVATLYCLRTLTLPRNLNAPESEVEFKACSWVVADVVSTESSIGAALTIADFGTGVSMTAADASTGPAATLSSCWAAVAVTIAGSSGAGA
jgi:hypothetical protein